MSDEWDQWKRDHAAGLHQKEIVSLVKEMEQHYPGHTRMIILLALTRSIAGILVPANKRTREAYLHELTPMLRNLLGEIDEMMANMNAGHPH